MSVLKRLVLIKLYKTVISDSQQAWREVNEKGRTKMIQRRQASQPCIGLPNVLLLTNILFSLFLRCLSILHEQTPLLDQMVCRVVQVSKIIHWSPAIERTQHLSTMSFHAIRPYPMRWTSTMITVVLHNSGGPTWLPPLVTLSVSCTEQHLQLAELRDDSRPNWHILQIVQGKRAHHHSRKAS